MQEMDILLKEAFGELIEQEYQQRPRNLPKHRFSMRFRIKMYRLVRQVGAKSKRLDGGSSMLELYRPVRSKRGLVIILALLLMLLGGTITAAETLVQWLNEIMLEQHGDHVKIRRIGTEISENREMDMDQKDCHRYILTEFPEGYDLLSEKYKPEFDEYQISYVNSEGNILFCIQNKMNNNIMSNLTSNKIGMEAVLVNGLDGYYIEDDDAISLVLTDGSYVIELFGKFSKEELISLAKKLQPIK